MEDREFPCSVHVNESTGRLEVRTDTKVHVYSESENQMILDTVVRLRDENAKLRELLADTLIDPRDYCAKYGIDYDGWDSANDDIDRRMRELGIEVDA